MKIARAAAPLETAADLLILPLLAGQDPEAIFPEIDAALNGALKRAAGRGFKGKFGTVAVIDTLGLVAAERVMLLGLGEPADIDRARLNNAMELGIRRAGSPLPARLAVAWHDGLGPAVVARDLACAAVEGAILATFSEATHKSGARKVPKPVGTIVLAGFPKIAGALLERSVVLAEETLFARGLVNTPALELYPEAYAAEARRHARGSGMTVEVLDHRRLAQLKYGAILAVGMSSSRPPRLVVLRNRPAPAPKSKRPLLALVGKGVTFDSGGISIKPAADMGYMKGDMGGSAAVLGAMTAIARLGLDVDVVGILCLAENMVSSTAMRPGDVVTSASGITIEVVNTDAEGRMVMADGMHHALQLGATHVLDIATLTGGQRIALGQVAGHVQGSDGQFTAHVLGAAQSSGERAWLMPSFPEYRSIIDSPIADVANSAARDGTAITAGLFLREFAAGRPWVHVDMAAPSWNRVGSIKDMPSGPTGYGVRLLVNLAERLAES
ncbi:MAG: leucyl aminopeptidase [Candidatus Dormibacteria bacterium]